MKVLIADDDQASRMVLVYALKSMGCELLLATDGNETLNIARKHPDLDLILLDISMPGLDGTEAARQIREFNKKVIIIIQSSVVMTDRIKLAMAAGCNDYLVKPLNLNMLKGMISKYFPNF